MKMWLQFFLKTWKTIPIWLRRSVFIGIVLFVVLTQVSFGYYMVRPGSAIPVSDLIDVEEYYNKFGNLYLTTVNQVETNGLLFLYGALHPEVELTPRERVIPPDIDPEEYREMMRQHMVDSQNMAKVIALSTLNYDVEIESEGVRVVDVAKDSPVEGILQAEDVIIKINDDPVQVAEEIVERVGQLPVGEKVDFSFYRNGEINSRTVQTAPHPDEEGRSYVGVFMKTEKWEPILPLEIGIDAGNIAGPSAGMMFVLEIINQMTEDDITGGHPVAGTGAIDLDGGVNTVGGIKHKVKAAEAKGAEYFLVPEENYEEAQSAASSIEAIRITEITEAIDFLESL